MFIKAASIGPTVVGRKGAGPSWSRRLWMFRKRRQAETAAKSGYQWTLALRRRAADGAGDARRGGAQPVAALCGRRSLRQRSAAAERRRGQWRRARRGGAIGLRQALGHGRDVRPRACREREGARVESVRRQGLSPRRRRVSPGLPPFHGGERRCRLGGLALA